MWLGRSLRSWMMYSPRSVSIGAMPWLLEMSVQLDLFRHHGFALGDGARAALLEDRGDDVARFGRIARPMHVPAIRLDLGLELHQQLIQMRERMRTDRARGFA